MSEPQRPDLRQAATILSDASSITVLTGAGVSAESGVPTFRGAGGLWRGRRAAELATPGAFERDPEEVWAFYRWRLELLAGVEPNPGHRALAELERRCDGFWLITQNVDGLHRKAGSVNVIEIHGTLAESRCTACGFRQPSAELPEAGLPTCPRCAELMRPAVVWFGEALPEHAMAAAREAIRRCEVMLVVGTSGVVEPAASFALRARTGGARVVEVNLEPTPLSRVADVSVLGPAGEVLPALLG